jgi:hypothetical protein
MFIQEPIRVTDVVRVPSTPARPSANTRSKNKLNYPEPHLKPLSDATYRIKKENCKIIGPANIPTTDLRSVVDKRSETRNRRYHALILAKQLFGRLPLDPHITTIEMEKVFAKELDDLKHITTGVTIFVPSLDANMINLDDEAYDLFFFDLEKRLRQATRSLQKEGLDIPDVPQWGYKEYYGMVYTANDFEILSIRYREEVENFLIYLFKNHQFEVGGPVSPIRSHFNRLDEFHTPMSGSEETIRQGKELQQKQLSPVKEAQSTIREFSRVNNDPVFRTEYEGVSKGLYDFQQDQASRIYGGRNAAREVSTLSNIFGNPEDNISSNKRQELFNTPNFKETQGQSSQNYNSRRGHGEPVSARHYQDSDDEYYENVLSRPARQNENRRAELRQPRGGGYPSDDDDSSDNRNFGRRAVPRGRRPPEDPDDDPNGRGFPRRDRSRNRQPPQNVYNRTSRDEPRFDLKLKATDVPEWDGDPDSLGRWLIKVNALATRSSSVFKQLGVVIPTRFTKAAEKWYYTLPDERRIQAEKNWESLRKQIASYWINRAWAERQRTRARDAAYRVQRGCHYESPSEYYIRKYELLTLVFDMSDNELIMQIMSGAPSEWNAILTTHLFDKVEDLQRAIKYHEDTLTKTGRPIRPQEGFRNRDFSNRNNEDQTPKQHFNNNSGGSQARTNLVGWSPNLGAPLFPKDDSTISKGKTPDQKGARPCRYCGSGKHWDNDCKHARKGAKQVRTNFASMTQEDLQAQDDYDQLYYEDSEEEDEQTKTDF